MRWVRNRALFLAFVALFAASWTGHLIAEWHEFVAEQQTHEAAAAFWSGDFWWRFWAATLENWQSEWLQLAGQIALPAQSKDSGERMEAKLDWLIQKAGHDPAEIEKELPEDYQHYGETQSRHTVAVLAGIVGASAAFHFLFVFVHLAT